MLTTFRQRMRDDDEGFTLIELMVVVLIIAILIAIAIPTFLGAQNRAKDRGAQSNLRNGMTNVRTIATDAEGKFTNVSVAALTTAEPNLTFVAGTGTPAAGSVAVLVEGTAPAAQTVTLWAQSKSGNWFGMTTDETGKITSCTGGSGTGAEAKVSTNAACVTNKTA